MKLTIGQKVEIRELIHKSFIGTINWQFAYLKIIDMIENEITGDFDELLRKVRDERNKDQIV